MPIVFDDAATPRTLYELQAAVSEALATGQATLDQEHTADGRHAGVTLDSLASRVIDTPPKAAYRREIARVLPGVVPVEAGLMFQLGPWLFDATTESAVIITSITANQARFAPQGIDTALVVEVSSDAARSIFGIAVPAPLRQIRRALRLVNTGNFDITLASNSGSATNTYERMFFGGNDYVLTSGTLVDLYYHPGSPIWRGPEYRTLEQVNQIRTMYQQTVTFTGAGGEPQTFNFSTAMADYTNALLWGYADNGTALRVRAISNTQFNVEGLPTGGGDFDCTINVLEGQNLDA